MIDRYGKPICVAWAQHEIVWIEAAMSLTLGERRMAFEDIAEMTGRSRANVQWKATHIANARRAAESRARVASQDPNTAMTLAPFQPPPSLLNTSPKMLARRMGARA